ncbi:AzlD domain-containing protein [Streptomyces sp. NPDC004539]|uniref:branched-chain amino acid transporter permease n=1 Tax=Streptomyces sp. NPDC004539 TaxID=3154280 RepID=UPI0033AA2F32
MPDTGHVLAAVAVAAAVTWALRALPFTVLGPLRSSALVQYLGRRMPAGVMVILLVYCLRDTRAEVSAVLPTALALTVTVGTHLWRRNALLSVGAGTAVYVTLVSTVFVV